MDTNIFDDKDIKIYLNIFEADNDIYNKPNLFKSSWAKNSTLTDYMVTCMMQGMHGILDC